MKILNLRSLDPSMPGVGLAAASQMGRDVWGEFGDDANALRAEAERIRKRLAGTDLDRVNPDDAEVMVAFEEQPKLRTHFQRERDRSIATAKKRHVLKDQGTLTCEVCGFNYAATCGPHGEGFIECHHTTPVSLLQEGQPTTFDDLALVCANCHRMLHRADATLTLAEVRDLLKAPS